MAEVKRYAVVDPDGNVVNSVLWDGESKWSPPAGHTLIQHDQAGPGGRFEAKGKNGELEYVPPPPESLEDEND